MRLSDEAIAHIAQLVQIAILTGTDVVDNLRMMELVNDDGALMLDEDYERRADDNVQRMIREAVNAQPQGVEQ